MGKERDSQYFYRWLDGLSDQALVQVKKILQIIIDETDLALPLCASGHNIYNWIPLKTFEKEGLDISNSGNQIKSIIYTIGELYPVGDTSAGKEIEVHSITEISLFHGGQSDAPLPLAMPVESRGNVEKFFSENIVINVPGLYELKQALKTIERKLSTKSLLDKSRSTLAILNEQFNGSQYSSRTPKADIPAEPPSDEVSLTNVTFDENSGIIRLGGLVCKIPDGSNQHYLCRLVFAAAPRKKITESEILEAIDPEEDTRRLVYDAVRAVNARAKRDLGVKAIFTWEKSRVWLNNKSSKSE